MVRSITLGLVAFGTAATLAAQAPAQPPTPSPERQPPSVDQPAPRTQTQAPVPSSSASSANKVTYSGCLKPGTTPGTWVLESASLSPGGAADRPVGTSGTASESFLLTTKPSDNLKPHANHKIEVTGVVGAASTTSTSSTTTTSTAPAAPGGAAAESKTSSSTASATSAPRQAITVDSFKMVSASCP